MSYKKAAEILPPRLLEEVQKYVDGGLIYIPKSGDRVGWGELTGSKDAIEKRNKEIIKLFQYGTKISKISEDYYLSLETVRKIVYGKKLL
ncbi:CD3324 family protein [Tissierella sp.]|uniref:CD3324 family protein n=1 Tax=Tissierella sp. TaxID=41274 RepID=UPI00285BD899|nr:CD3324 family protein [Tissierella sp.]MDR7857416.1 CD3324 family protein [Tissierella sp.]